MSPSRFLLYTLLATLVLVSSAEPEPPLLQNSRHVTTNDIIATRTSRTPPLADPPSFPPHFKPAHDAAAPESPKVEPLCFGFHDLFPPSDSPSPVAPTPTAPTTPPTPTPTAPTTPPTPTPTAPTTPPTPIPTAPATPPTPTTLITPAAQTPASLPQSNSAPTSDETVPKSSETEPVCVQFPNLC